jgi:hypothetical protein
MDDHEQCIYFFLINSVIFGPKIGKFSDLIFKSVNLTNFPKKIDQIFISQN